jgi:hypothetical protein
MQRLAAWRFQRFFSAIAVISFWQFISVLASVNTLATASE